MVPYLVVVFNYRKHVCSTRGNCVFENTFKMLKHKLKRLDQVHRSFMTFVKRTSTLQSLDITKLQYHDSLLQTAIPIIAR